MMILLSVTVIKLILPLPVKCLCLVFSFLDSFHHTETREPVLTTAPSLASLDFTEQPQSVSQRCSHFLWQQLSQSFIEESFLPTSQGFREGVGRCFVINLFQTSYIPPNSNSFIYIRPKCRYQQLVSQLYLVSISTEGRCILTSDTNYYCPYRQANRNKDLW